jgi:hypothetical protein
MGAAQGKSGKKYNILKYLSILSPTLLMQGYAVQREIEWIIRE